MSLQGLSFIGSSRGAAGGASFHAVNPATGESLDPPFHSASASDAEAAAAAAAAAFPIYSQTSGAERATFLRTIASEIEALGQTLTDRAVAESGLPEPRIKGETGRTCGQLRLFATLIEEGSWVDARIDHADPARTPAPKPDTRSMLRPIGPVVVFGASNFPLAFSVAGGDTASALAAGCPVIVKAHSAHPGTSELVAAAVRRAVAQCGLPDGTFSALFDNQRAAAMTLVTHHAVRGVGFTGSRSGGRALMDAAAARPEPIPVYAEMSSVNPVFLLRDALTSRGPALATGLHASVTLGSGQFCTNPGLVLFDASADATPFLSELSRLFSTSAAGTMLTAGICKAYQSGTSTLAANPAVTSLASAAAAIGTRGAPALFQTSAAQLLADPSLTEEVFGPATLLVACSSIDEMLKVTNALEGQLTATIHGTEADFASAAPLLAAAERRAGRLVCNGFPTGVEVCQSIVHGGPYPATSDGRSTSVGTAAILRWVRPVCWQDMPDSLLPHALRNANPLGIQRLVNSSFTR
jgi:NADP-dependent aldehyde dehydrogenase